MSLINWGGVPVGSDITVAINLPAGAAGTSREASAKKVFSAATRKTLDCNATVAGSSGSLTCHVPGFRYADLIVVPASTPTLKTDDNQLPRRGMVSPRVSPMSVTVDFGSGLRDSAALGAPCRVAQPGQRRAAVDQRLSSACGCGVAPGAAQPPRRLRQHSGRLRPAALDWDEWLRAERAHGPVLRAWHEPATSGQGLAGRLWKLDALDGFRGRDRGCGSCGGEL